MTKMAKISLNWYPIYDQNSWKTIPFGTTHTYVADIKENPPPPREKLFELSNFFIFRKPFRYMVKPGRNIRPCNQLIRLVPSP